MQYDVHGFIDTVMDYWEKCGRHDLPWRHTDAYGVLVSEIMLQQTQVHRVTPYFERWMMRFPHIETLATAALADVLKEWSGLGYNRRAKMLHECGKEILATHGGIVPRDYAALKALPGIGPYTAGAIRAFAFDEPEIFIETNIRAALIHLFFPRAKNIDDKKLIPILRACLVDVPSARAWYSALMDYGAHLKVLHPNPSRRSKHHTKQSKFEGSLRQVRGEILKAITRGGSLAAVRQKHARYKDAYQSLVRDGLISK